MLTALIAEDELLVRMGISSVPWSEHRKRNAFTGGLSIGVKHR